jgi:hypothetical protein
MAQKVNIVLVDDLDQSEASETVNFGLDGANYEIDLSAENAAALRACLEQYTAVARRVSGRRNRRSHSLGSDAKIVRDWAKGQGIPVPTRGRIPAEVRAAYEAAS